MCVYIMEKMEREVGFLARILVEATKGIVPMARRHTLDPRLTISDNGLGTSSTESLPANSPFWTRLFKWHVSGNWRKNWRSSQTENETAYAYT